MLVGAFGTSAVAQELSGRLTLSEALEIARERNPEYRQAVNRLDAASAEVRAGFGRFLPNVSASMGWFGSNATRLTGENDFGEPVSLPDPIEFRSSSASQNLSASLTLFDGLSNLHSYRAAGAAAEASQAAAALTLRRVLAETTRRFYDALRTEGLIELERRLLEQTRQQLEHTERLFRTAGASREDVLGARADLANQELQLARAAGDARKARLALAEQLGIEERVEFEVAGELPPVFDPATLDADSLVAAALTTNPELRQLDWEAEAAHLRATAAHGQRWPAVQLSASLGRWMSLSSYDALFQLDPRNRSFGFGLTFSFPLFRGFQTSTQIAQANVEADNADLRLLAGRLAVERAVRNAVIDLTNAHRALELAQQAAELSRERLALARERYALASLDFTALQLIIRQANEAERQLVEARFGFAAAAVTLHEVVGAEIQP